jgi:serine/threonine protein kinase
MGSAPVGPLHLPPGTQVGRWRVEAWRGQGAYGAVYRAVRVGQESAGPVALKLSLHLWDRRFAREAELLSRLSHPSIPRLLDRGVLHHPSGAEQAWFVMEWVEGTPLYAWAEQHAASSREVCRVLAQVARALEAMHAAGCVHRDVKGDNVLVRLSDRCAVLLDFGSGHFQGAERLTWQGLAPGTPGYFSAQACLFDLNSVRNRDGYYAPTPADDLYALGVTAYRLVMGDYPPPMDVRKDEEGSWHVSSPGPRPLLENNPRVESLLREWILQLLSDDPEVRGTAAQVAEALEAAAKENVPELPAEPQPAAEVLSVNVPVPPEGSMRPERVRPPARAWAWKPWLALAAAGVCGMLLRNMPPVPVQPQHVSASPVRASGFQQPDAGTSAVGDISPTESQASTLPSRQKKPMAQEPLPEPRPGQIRPDKKGQCPGPKQVPINGGCWGEVLPMSAEECAENGYVRFKGKCYAPLAAPKQPQPTSSPAEAR